MRDLEQVLTDAWLATRPRLLSDPVELAKRLARRRTPSLTRPLRIYCIAVKANDTRIDPGPRRFTSSDALADGGRSSGGRPSRVGISHPVLIDQPLIQRLVGAVDLRTWRGHRIDEAAAKLGVSSAAVGRYVRDGKLNCDRIKGLGGSKVPVPLLWADGDQLLDPNSTNACEAPDPVWGSLWTYLAGRVPVDFEQIIERVPVLRASTKSENASKKLPPNWHGWRWLCPACRTPVATIFYPTAPPLITEYLRDESAFAPHEADAPPRPPATFACHDCHRIRYWSRLDDKSWNTLVCYLSGGLLFGREVQKPPWWQPQRKRRYRPHTPHITRGHDVERLLLAGRRYDEIASEMKIALATVQGHVRRIYRRHAVHSRKELIAAVAGIVE